MATTLPIYYAGPGKVFWKAPYSGGSALIGLQPTDVNGQITCSVDMKTTPRGTAMYGELFETLDDVTGKIGMTPFDNWSLLPYLFPWYLGVTTAGTNGGTGLLQVGTSPHDPTNAGLIYGAGVWTSDQREYSFNRAALTKHPTMKFCPGEKLFGAVEFSALGQLVIGGATTAALPGQEGFLMGAVQGTSVGNPISESAPASGALGAGTATDPDATGFTISDFAQTHWTGTWGPSGSPFTGFGALEAEDGWDLVPDVKYNSYTVQKVTRVMKLSSSRFMMKGRIVGMSHTQLLSYILGASGSGGYGSGSIITQSPSASLVLTGSNGKTVTLANVSVKTAPFEFGSTKLNLGEVGFVTEMLVTNAGPNSGSAVGAVPSLTFSA